MTFSVIDTTTGEYPDLWKIALEEEWAKRLCYCDMEGFAIEEDGALVLMDECGQCVYPPDPDRFKVVPCVATRADQIRAMTDEELAVWMCDRSCSLCPLKDCKGRMEVGRTVCYNRWFDWLRQEVTE